MSAPFGFGEKIAVMSDDLIQKAIKEQAPDHVKVYDDKSGATEKDVLSLRLDFQSWCLKTALRLTSALQSISVSLNKRKMKIILLYAALRKVNKEHIGQIQI